MPYTPAVSILIPSFNQDPVFLKECVDSALSQTFQDIEVVVSDNHSTNGATRFLESYTDPRLRVVSPPEFVSMNDNFAFCASQARGTYLSFLSSDDLLLPVAIAALHAALEARPEAVFACGNIYHARKLPPAPIQNKLLLRPYGTMLRAYSPSEAVSFFFPWKMASTWMAGDLIRRKAYEKTGGMSHSTLRIASDVWLTGELLKCGGFVCLESPLALFRSRASVPNEGDPDRRLFDLEYTITLAAKGDSPVAYQRQLFQRVKLVYRLGALQSPSPEAISKVETTFAGLGRHDFVRLIAGYRRCGVCFRLLAGLLRALDICRSTMRVALNRLQRNGLG